MEPDSNSPATRDPRAEIVKEKFSVLVRARLLFQREVAIDRGSAKPLFDQVYLLRLIDTKRTVDMQMNKLLASAAAFSLLLYLVGKGMDPEIPLWGLKLSNVPGVLSFLALLSGYTTAMAAYAFFNSQTYVALIDQIIIFETRHGIVDVDMLKAGYVEEWLIFKALRRDFSFYDPVHINFGLIGKAFSLVTFSLMIIVAIMPFIALIITVPYLASNLIENDLAGILTKGFVYLCVVSVVLLLIVSSLEFTCEVKLPNQ